MHPSQGLARMALPQRQAQVRAQALRAQSLSSLLAARPTPTTPGKPPPSLLCIMPQTMGEFSHNRVQGPQLCYSCTTASTHLVAICAARVFVQQMHTAASASTHITNNKTLALHNKLTFTPHCCGAPRRPLPHIPSASPAQFALLQQHIDELTEEKLELQRGLAAQARLAASLSEENSVLAEQYNAQGKTVEALQKKVWGGSSGGLEVGSGCSSGKLHELQ